MPCREITTYLKQYSFPSCLYGKSPPIRYLTQFIGGGLPCIDGVLEIALVTDSLDDAVFNEHEKASWPLLRHSNTCTQLTRLRPSYPRSRKPFHTFLRLKCQSVRNATIECSQTRKPYFNTLTVLAYITHSVGCVTDDLPVRRLTMR